MDQAYAAAYKAIMEERKQEEAKDLTLAVKGLQVIEEKGIEAASMYLNYSARVFSYMLYADDRKLIPPAIRTQYALEHYTNHGDNYRNICGLVRRGLKYRPADWDKDMSDGFRGWNEYTVYRAGMEPIETANESISWTLSRDIAEWFAERSQNVYHVSRHIYMAKIPADKIIRYTNGRLEYEVMQYKSVYDIVELPNVGMSPEFQRIKKTRDSHLTADHSEFEANLQAYVDKWIVEHK